MSAVTFDTLKVVETLESAGFDRAHASAVASVMRDSQISASADIATKSDIALLRLEIEAQSNKIIVRVGGLFIAVLGALEIINRAWPAS